MGVVGELDYERLFQGVPAALLVLDPDLTIRQVTDTYLAATRTRRPDIVGRPLFEVFPDDPADSGPSSVGDLRASLRRTADTLMPDTMPIQRYAIPVTGSADGRFETRFWAPVNAPVLDAEGRLAWIVHRADDVTAYVRDRFGDPSQDRLTAELAEAEPVLEAMVLTRRRLLEQNHALQAVLDSLDTVVLGCDRTGRVVLSNQAARDLETAEQLLGREPVARALHGEAIRDVEVVVDPAPGRPGRHLLVHGGPVDHAGPLAAVVALHDITAQRMAERLKDCELRVASIFAKPEPVDLVIANAIELIGDMLGWAGCEYWTVDSVGQFLRRQNTWWRDDRTSRAGPPDQLGAGEGPAGRAWQQAEPVWVTGSDADARWALALPIPTGATVGGILVCYSDFELSPDDLHSVVLTGITAHFGKFLERRRADQIAAELERTRDEYIALAGHELRTPLTTIQAYTDMLRADPDLPGAERHEMLEVIHRRTTDLYRLVTGLLDVAGTRAGHTRLDLRRADLAVIARAAADAVRETTAGVVIDVDSPPSVVVRADPDRIRDALDELLRNAVTWAPEQSSIGVAVHGDQHSAVIAVSNTGPRIPVDHHEQVFELFYRSDTLRHGGIPGTGLGLTRARAIVEQHQGTLTVSEPDEATTTFTIRLPRTGTD